MPADYVPAEKFNFFPPLRWVLRARRKLFGDYAFVPDYKSHPDPNQEAFFFGLVRECVEKRIISEDLFVTKWRGITSATTHSKSSDRVEPLRA